MCKEWNTFVEEKVSTPVSGVSRGSSVAKPKSQVVTLSSVSTTDEERTKTGIKELDRVLGGGIVQGSLVLVGGDPGIGKSTLLLQVCQKLADKQKKVKPLFPFGHGLSYTTFAYGKPAADKKVMSADDQISFTVTVKNIGDREGQEVVQLYISDKKSSLPRPVKELKGFKKVKLAPGETKEVTFTIDKEALSFFDDTQHAWVAEPGKFEAVIAASAADVKGTVPFELK